MLITLREHEYLPVLDEWVDHPGFESFVSILGEMLSRGDHAVDASPRLLRRFSEWTGLSRAQRKAFEVLARAIVTHPLAFKEVTHGLLLVGPAKPLSEPVGPIHWYQRDWTWLQQRGHLERTMLGGENLDDARWFEWLGRAWAVRLRSRARSTTHEHGSPTADHDLSLRCRGLGGTTAQQDVPHEAAEGDPVLCILDSDRNHRDAELGGTAKGLAKALKAAPNVERILHVEHLQARDVENLLPLELVKRVSEAKRWLAPMERRGFFACPKADEDLRYLDLGKDQCERRLLDTKDDETKSYRTKAIERMRANDKECIASASTCERVHGENPECLGKIALPASCIIVHSIGKPLRRIVETLDAEQHTPQASRPHPSPAAWLAAMLPDDDPAVLAPARLAWSWGLCSRPRIRATSGPRG